MRRTPKLSGSARRRGRNATRGAAEGTPTTSLRKCACAMRRVRPQHRREGEHERGEAREPAAERGGAGETRPSRGYLASESRELTGVRERAEVVEPRGVRPLPTHHDLHQLATMPPTADGDDDRPGSVGRSVARFATSPSSQRARHDSPGRAYPTTRKHPTQSRSFPAETHGGCSPTGRGRWAPTRAKTRPRRTETSTAGHRR